MECLGKTENNKTTIKYPDNKTSLQINTLCYSNSTVHAQFIADFLAVDYLISISHLSGVYMWLMRRETFSISALELCQIETCCLPLLSLWCEREAAWCWMLYTVQDVRAWSSDLSPAGMIIQTMVFFLCLLVAVFLIIMPILHQQNLFLFQILWSMWWASPRLSLIKRLCSTAASLERCSPLQLCRHSTKKICFSIVTL